MIPDSAIEAAHKAWRAQAALDGSIFEYNLRAAIEAAAPHMLAAAWDAGHEGGMSDAFAADKGFTGYHANPYRPTP